MQALRWSAIARPSGPPAWWHAPYRRRVRRLPRDLRRRPWRDANAPTVLQASKVSSVRAEPIAHHGAAVCCQSAGRRKLTEKCHETATDPSGAILDLSGAAAQRADLS